MMISINHLAGDRPTLVYIIIPDEIPIYDELAGSVGKPALWLIL